MQSLHFIASKTSSECWLMVVAIVMVSWTTDFVVLAAKSPIGDSGVQSVFFQQTRLNEANLYADRVFHVLNNMMNSTNLTFVINCVNKDYFRYEFAIQNVLKKAERAYSLVQIDTVPLSTFMTTRILQRLSTTGDMWYDIFLLCWDDGKDNLKSNNTITARDRADTLDDLMEIFKEEVREFGNVRWIFWNWQHVMKRIQTICGVIYVNINGSAPFILAEPMDEIRRCGGRIIFMDIESPTISALRNPREVDTSIFKHEINFAQLKHLQVLCGLLNRSQGYPLTDYCEENPQKEILSALARKVELHFNFSSSGFFGRRLKTEDYDFHEREKSFYLHQGKYNGTGLIGDLQQRLFDINVVSVFPSEDLQDAITFASSYYRFDQLTFFAPPAIMEFGSLKTIWMPFKPDVWACVIAMIIGVSSIMAIFVKLKFGKTWFSYNLFYMSQPMTARLPVIPRQFHRVLPIYILLAAWLLGSYLISMFYSGVLTSFRQHPRTTPVIDTFQALEAILSQQSKRSSTSTTCSGDCMAVAVLNDTKYRAILKSEGGSSYLDLARKHLTYCSKVEQCIDLVIQRKHVFLSSDYTMKWYVGTDPKNGVVQRAKDNINAGRLSITLQKGSPIQNQVTRINQQLFELGAFEKIVALEEYQLKPIYNKTNLIPPSSVMTTTDMRGLFELFAMGSFFSLLAALLERLL